MMRQVSKHTRARVSQPSGYTLVEMLVAIGLVVLMMSLFAEIFQLAGGSIATQRGIAENDQRARTLSILIRGDLDKRTFRNVAPFYPGEDPATSNVIFSDRQGYFYISENNRGDGADDILQFTVRSTIRTRNKDETPYYGQADLLTPDINGNGSLVDDFFRNPNQPEADDGQITINSTASSTAAEITYFVRNGILYRRQLLIREPLPIAGADEQPQLENGDNLFDHASAITYSNRGANADFWEDFDFSAYYTGSGARFNGISALVNDDINPVAVLLAKPNYRYGFSQANGLPREYVNMNTDFIGRFTHEETSSTHFNYPHLPARNEVSGSVIGNGNPYDTANTPLQLNAKGTVQQFAGGPRRAEDMVMSNVHSFDVKVWDDRIGDFVDLGHLEQDSGGNPVGDFRMSQRRNTQFGPRAAGQNRVFDTWHPTIDLAGDGNLDFPPFLPARVGPDGQPGVLNVDDDGDGNIDNATELGWPTSDDIRLPLRAIQLTIRYYNVKTDRIRQFTLVHSLRD